MLYPLRLTPIYQTAIWGGRKFETFLGRDLPEGDFFAESWDVSCHPRGVNLVQNGPFAGRSIQDIFENYRAELMGPYAESELVRFPLMVKFLDANRQLSVQVHPNEEYVSEKRLQDSAKSEAWVVLQASPGSLLTLGFQYPVTRREVAEALEKDELESILFKREPVCGECYFLPAGTVHSLGAGIFLYEIQQCSDLTFRLYDWNRKDSAGKMRELHVQQALDTLKPEHWNSEPIQPVALDEGRELLVESSAFCLHRLTFGSATLKSRKITSNVVESERDASGKWEAFGKRDAFGKFGGSEATAFQETSEFSEAPRPQRRSLDVSRSCHVLTVVGGTLEVEGLEEPLRLGDSVILPASLGKVVLSGADAEVLDACLPEGE